MRRELAVPFVDSSADQLVHSLTTGPREPLHAQATTVGELTIELRILGSSHQVIIEGLGAPFVETVACATAEGMLPDQVHLDQQNYGYDFTSDVSTYSQIEFSERVGDVLAELDGDDAALVGVFPGDELAVTALRLERSGLGWKTWHCYPNTGEVVTTQTRIQR